MQVNGQSLADVIMLLNDLNDAAMKRQWKLDDVIMASTLLLASALRQVGGEHGKARAKYIAESLPKLLDLSNESLSEFFSDR